MFIDSHCHLNYDDFNQDLEEVILRAESAGVTRMLSVCTTLEEAHSIQNLALSYNHLNCSVGVHPHNTADTANAGISLEAALEKLLQGPKVVALGETGLDYHYQNSASHFQKEAFRTHIRLAKKHDIPLIVHTREADEDTVALLAEEKGNIRGVIYCFSGTEWLAKKVLELGFYISISGIVTFKNAATVQEIVKKIVPLDRLLVETDAPYLAPIPHRGKRNEPAFVVHVAEAVAALKNVSMSEIQQTTTRNYLTLFGWKDGLHRAKG